MGGPGKYYSKRNKEEERQILYDFTHIWNLKKTSSKEMKKKIINTENKLVVTKEIEGWRVSKMGKRSIVCCCFLTEKFLSAPGLSSYLFSVMVRLFHWLFCSRFYI